MKIWGTFKLNIVRRPAGDAQPAWDARLGGYFRCGASGNAEKARRDWSCEYPVIYHVHSSLSPTTMSSPPLANTCLKFSLTSN